MLLFTANPNIIGLSWCSTSSILPLLLSAISIIATFSAVGSVGVKRCRYLEYSSHVVKIFFEGCSLVISSPLLVIILQTFCAIVVPKEPAASNCHLLFLCVFVSSAIHLSSFGIGVYTVSFVMILSRLLSAQICWLSCKESDISTITFWLALIESPTVITVFFPCWTLR